MTVTIDDIKQASRALGGHILNTPTLPSEAISNATGADVVIKLENLQVTGSFKSRGAFIKLSKLTDQEKSVGVVAVSAGNHAQGVAYHAAKLGVPATIFMPEGTPFTKVGRTEALGATVILEGENLTEAWAAAEKMVEQQGQVFVHPFDDPDIITGQGTVGLELISEYPDLDVLIVPIGGGGLISGCAIAAKALNPEIEVVGVQSSLYPAMAHILAGENAPDEVGATIAEGIAVKNPGDLTRRIVAELVSDVILVDEIAIEKAVQLYLEGPRVVAEGAGAAPLAALMTNAERFQGRRVGLIVSGGNMDSRLLSSVLMRGLVREGRLVSLRIKLPDVPGVLAKVSGLIGESGGNIIEVYHQRLNYDVPIKEADLDVVVETLDRKHVGEILIALETGGFPVRLLDSEDGRSR
jgi:threonine dehydratase